MVRKADALPADCNFPIVEVMTVGLVTDSMSFDFRPQKSEASSRGRGHNWTMC